MSALFSPPSPARFPVLRLLCLLLALAAAVGQAAEPQKFQKVPKGESLQPEPPPDKGFIQFIGNTSFTTEELRVPLAQSIKEIQESGMTKPRADDAAYFVAVFYRKQGFPDVDVRWEIRGSQARLTIKEGPRTYLGQVTFQGNKQVSTAELYDYLIGGTLENQGGKPVLVPFVEADVQTGVARVRGQYENDGRLDAVVEDAVITYSKDHSRADVLVKIQEGPRYTFGEIVFAGPTAFERAKLLDALGEPLQNAYTTQRVNTMQHNLEFFFKLQGYYAATVEAAGDPKAFKPGPLKNRRVPVTFTIKAGPLYHFDGLVVKGLDRLKPSFLQHRFQPLHGQVYNPNTLDEKYREILRTGLFRNMRINTIPLATDEVQVELTVEEAKAKEIGFSVGFSTYEGFILGLRLADRDFLGDGRPLSLEIDYTSRALRAELLYVDPWLFESSIAMRSRIFVQSRTEEGYTKNEQGIRADFTRKINSHWELGVFASLRNVGITDPQIEPQFLGPTSYQVATLGLTQTLDYRDNPVNPSKGWIIGTAVDADTIAGEIAFGRATGRLTYFQPVFNRYLLALGARGGIIYPVSEIPIDERYFNGGGNTVRSFAERELGPRDKGNHPIGGEVFTVFNVELQIPVKDALSAALFVDAGNLISEFKEASFNDMRYAVGVGARYKLPIGPVRLDVGLNPTPKMKEDWGAVHFSFGFAF